jgi:hypothetical protein
MVFITDFVLDDIFSYMKYGEAKEEEMEAHFGRMLEEGTHFLSFTQVSKVRTITMSDQDELLIFYCSTERLS